MNDNEPSPQHVIPPSHRRAVTLTHVELTWIEKKIEHWLRFGRRAEEKILDRRRSIASFAPNNIFAFVRWATNDYGTIISRMSIRQSCNHAFAPERQLSIFPTRARGRHDRDVDDARSQIEKQPILSAVDGVDVDLWEPPMVFGQRGSQVSCGERYIDADRQSSRLAARHVLEPCKRGVGFFDDVPGGLEKLVADRGRSGAAIGSFEQFRSHAIFETAERAA